MDAQGYPIPLGSEDIIANEINYKQKLNTHKLFQSKSINYWTPVGPNQVFDNNNKPSNDQSNVYTIDQCMASPNVLYCGTEPGEVYKSTDTAETWRCVSLFDDFSGGVTALEVSPTNPDIVFAGGNAYIKRSINGGNSWSLVLSANGLNANEILINSGNTQIVMVAGDAGLYRSVDGGATFTQLFTQRCFDIKQNTANPSILYLVKDNPTTLCCEFFRSTDSGQSWVQQTSGWYASTDAGRNNGGARIGVTPADSNRVYVYLIGEAKTNDYGFIGVYRSNDGGSSWTLPNAPTGGPYTATHQNLAYGNPTWTYHQGFYNCALMVSSSNADKILIGGLNTWRSNDGGSTFSPVSGYVSGGNLNMHVDMQDYRAVGNYYWLTCDGGIYRSPDFFADSVIHKCTGIRASEYWGFGSGWNQDILVGGLYHNGNIAYNESFGQGNFLSLGGGEASTGYINPGNNHKAYFSDIGGKYVPDIITDPINSFSIGLSPNETYYSAESSEMEFYPYCYNIAFIGKDNKLWKTLDGGSSYNLQYAFGTDSTNQVKYIEISRSNPNVMYINQQPVSGSIGKLWKTTNGGLNWTQLNIPAGNSRKMLLSLDYTNENILWLAYPDGANGAKMYKTMNGGTSWANITTTTLNGENVHSLVSIPNTNGGIYYCTGKTVYYRNNSMSDWIMDNDSLPAFFNCDIARPFYRDEKLRIASYGKGIWEKSFYEAPTAPVAQIMVDKLSQTVVCNTDSFYFDDYSVLNHSNATWQWTFQNGHPATSNVRNPAVYFSNPGTYQVHLTVTDGNGHSDSDSMQVTINNYIQPSFVQEGFQTVFPPSDIYISNPNNDHQWSQYSGAGGFGNSAQCAIFDNFNNDSHGHWDDMRISLNYTNPANTRLTFDVAHATYGGIYTDTLQVLASTDCGDTFTKLYSKWGTTLSTAPSNTNFFQPASGEWRTDTVDLAAFVGNPQLVIAFRNIGLWGNAIYIDNININSINVGIIDVKPKTIDVYPNPVAVEGSLYIQNPDNETLKITLMDTKGSLIINKLLLTNNIISLSPFHISPGLYFLSIKGETQIRNKKIIVR